MTWGVKNHKLCRLIGKSNQRDKLFSSFLNFIFWFEEPSVTQCRTHSRANIDIDPDKFLTNESRLTASLVNPRQLYTSLMNLLSKYFDKIATPAYKIKNETPTKTKKTIKKAN